METVPEVPDSAVATALKDNINKLGEAAAGADRALARVAFVAGIGWGVALAWLVTVLAQVIR